MQVLSLRHTSFRMATNAVCIAAAMICNSGTANENEVNPTQLPTHRPYHPHLEPAPTLMEMEAGDPVERAIARSARALFPDLARGSLPATEFGTIMLGHSPCVLLFRETDGRTLVEKRELELGIRSRRPGT